MMQCLEQIVGITTSDCQCIVQGLTTEEINALQAAKSGLFLDDLEGGVHLKALTRVDACRNMAAMALKARDNAIRTVADDLVVALNGKYKPSKRAYAGNIGRMSYAGTLNVSRPIQGMRISPVDDNDGMLVVNRMHIIVNGSVNLNVQWWRVPKAGGLAESVSGHAVEAQANAFTLVPGPFPIQFPLRVNGEAYDYYVVYNTDVPGGPVMPKDTGIKCNTCEKGKGFTDYITVQGVQLNSVSNLEDRVTDNQYSHGIILDAEVKCNNSTLVCREYKEDDAVAVVLAYATRYKAGELLIEDVIKQPDVSRYTTMAKEYLWGKRNHFRKEYETRIAYLAASIDVSESNCYVCREQPNQPFFSPIFS